MAITSRAGRGTTEGAARAVTRRRSTRTKQIIIPQAASSPESRTHHGSTPEASRLAVGFCRPSHVAETRVQTHVDIAILPAKRGEWTDTDGTVVTLALDAKGRAAFHQLYHELPPFVPCKQCPHQDTETS